MSPVPNSASPKTVNINKKDILILFRFLIFAIVVIFSFFNLKNANELLDYKIIALSVAYCLSMMLMLWLNPKRFEDSKLLSVFFVTDTIFIVLGIHLAGIAETDLSLIFFMTVFISALSQDVRSVFLVALVSCSIYAFLHFRLTGEFWSSDTEYLIRFPFLFVASAMSGYMAVETKKNKEERATLMALNDYLAQRTEIARGRLMETNQKLKSLLEYHDCVLGSLKTGVLVADKEGKITTLNKGARTIVGLAEDQCFQFLSELPDNLKPVILALSRTLEEEKGYVRDHLELKTTRSEIIPVTLETSLLRNPADEVIGAIATLRDMSLLRQMENQLTRSERLSALGEMAAGVAHEIKNPLNAVLGFSQRLSDHLEDPKMKKYADVIVEEVHRIDGIVNDVLEYSRPDQIHKTPTHLYSVMDEVVEFLHDKTQLAKVSVERDYVQLPAVPMDRPKIHQVLLNLMLNAIQAMEGGGKLTLKIRPVAGLVSDSSVQTEADAFQQLFLEQKMVAISVKDTGAGITQENLAKLFHPFFTTKVTGTGLGLSICHKIVTSHGGTLNVESEAGQGSVFTVYLPMA